MSYEDRKRSLWNQRESDEADVPIARRSVAPGKRTLTMSMPPHPASSPGSVQAPVQQKTDPAAVMQRKEQTALTDQWMDVALRPDLHDAPVQRKSAGDEERDQAFTSVPADGGGKAMPEDVRARMEGVFGTDFSGVRIHEGLQAPAMGALAYTQGTDVHFASGEYDPSSQRGLELLGHELTHVVQQSQGRAQAATQAKGVGVNDDAGLEREADEMGVEASRGPDSSMRRAIPLSPVSAGVVQQSSLSEELARIWQEQGRGAFFQRIRQLGVCVADPDVYQWVDANLAGDDHWLATNLLLRGPESLWPLHLRIEREMKGWGDSGGRDEVMRLLRAEAGNQAGNAQVSAAIETVFPSQSLDRWLALRLQEKGDEANFDLKEKMIQWYLEHNELTAINEINARGLSVVTFTGAFDRWRLSDGSEEITDLSSRLRGNSSGSTIRINASLSTADAVTTLYHEVQHQVVEGLPYLDEEIEVRARTEQMAIDTGLPETVVGYRNSDNTVNRPAIDSSVRGSSHYNPSGRTRIGRWYEGEVNTGSWALP